MAGLTEAILPVAEAAVTARLDCRRAFLNMMEGRTQRSGREDSLKGEMGGMKREERRGDGRGKREACRVRWEDSAGLVGLPSPAHSEDCHALVRAHHLALCDSTGLYSDIPTAII